MMAAAAMGATAFQKGLGAIHALSHPVGSLYDTHHGMTNAVFMPYVLAFNRPAVEDRIARLAAYLGLAASFDAFLDFVLALRRDIGVPHTLDGLGVDDDKAETVAVDGARRSDRRQQPGGPHPDERAPDFLRRHGGAALRPSVLSEAHRHGFRARPSPFNGGLSHSRERRFPSASAPA